MIQSRLLWLLKALLHHITSFFKLRHPQHAKFSSVAQLLKACWQLKSYVYRVGLERTSMDRRTRTVGKDAYSVAPTYPPPFQSGPATRQSSLPMPHVTIAMQPLQPPPTGLPSVSPGNLPNGGPISPTHDPDGSISVSPFSPEELANTRNELPGQIDPSRGSQDRIPPHKLAFSVPDVPDGWTQYMHPSGAIYFHHADKNVLTHCDLSVDTYVQSINAFSDFLLTELQESSSRNPPVQSQNADLVIDLVHGKGGAEKCKYYFVDHDKKVVFWLTRYDPSPIYFNVRGVQADGHIRLALETQYWSHCQLFPPNTLDIGICDSLRGILVSCICGAILADSSLVPYTNVELQQMLDLTTSIRTNLVNEGSTFERHSVYVIARMMRIFTRMKFMNFYGQVGVRLNADQPLYANDPKDNSPGSHMLLLLNIILLGAPSSHLKRLRGLWIDNTVNLLRWRDFIGIVNTEWSGFTTYSTVMLAVNVSFLAVPGVIGTAAHQMVAVTSIYLSTMFSVGSLVSAVLLTGRSRGQVTQSASKAVSYMLDMAATKARLETLAVIYSLPFAFLMWGMVGFVVALCDVIYSSYGLAAGISMVICCASVVGMALSPVWHRLSKATFAD